MAIIKETFRTLIHEGQEEIRDVELYDRPFDFEENGRYVLVGVRQAGKSYMLYKRARQMLDAGWQLEDMVYINFDDERLIGMTADEFDLILQAYLSVYNRPPLCCSLTRYRMLRVGNTSPAAWPTRSTMSISPAAMPGC